MIGQLRCKEACRCIVRYGDIDIANWCVESGPLKECDYHTKFHILLMTSNRNEQLLNQELKDIWHIFLLCKKKLHSTLPAPQTPSSTSFVSLDVWGQ
jgi:hypothetical protein